MKNLNLTALAAALLATAPVAARAANVTLAFTEGYVGTQGSNTQQADNIKTLATLGVSYATFSQVDADNDGKFDLDGSQGNDVKGTLTFVCSSGTRVSKPTYLNFRETTTGQIDVFGFVFYMASELSSPTAAETAAAADQTISCGGTFPSFSVVVGRVTSNPAPTGQPTNVGLVNYGRGVTLANGQNRSGNAATASTMLAELNAALDALNLLTLTIGTASVNEGANLVYTGTITSVAYPRILAFDVAGTATSGSDFSAAITFSNGIVNNGDGTITIPANVSSFTATIGTTADAVLAEGTETVILTISGKTATGNILDAGCTADSQCTSAQFCNGTTGLCTAKLGNGTAIPNDSLHGGTCTASNATAVCTSGLCNATTNTCGASNGTACTAANQCVANVCGSNGQCGGASGTGTCTAANAATACQSGICSTNSGTCIAAGTCWDDTDCAATSHCNRNTGVCTADMTSGTAIPNDGLHGGLCTANVALAVCTSGQCNATTNTCSSSNGTDCTAANQCTANVCGANGKCGGANGSGTCTAGTAATACQSGACSVSNVCIPPGGCAVDGDCTGGLLCEVATFTCKDLTPPNTFIDSPVAAILPATNLTKNASTDFEFSAGADTATATYECSLNGGAFTACPADHTVGPLTDGVYTLAVRAVDAAGNRDPTPATYSWTVDLTPPETFIDTKPDAITSQTTGAFTFSSDTTGATFECKLDGAAAFTPCPASFTTGTLADGPHTLLVRAKDPAGNVDATPVSYSWTVDSAVPETTIDTKPAASTPSTVATFTFGSNASPVTYECKLDGAVAFAACPASFTTGTLAEGPHTLLVRAKNSAGTVDPTPESYTWTVDFTSPDTEIPSKPSVVSNDPDARFTFSSNDPTATFECSLNGGAFVPCPANGVFPGLADGAYTLAVRAKDPAGNVDTTPATYAWTVDTSVPDTTITTKPAASTPSTVATFTFGSNASPVTYECKLDGAADFTACPATLTTGTLAEGPHTLLVRAKNAAGTVDPTPASYTWTVDVTAPDTEIPSKPGATTNDPDARFTFASNDPTATFECSLNGGAFVPCPVDGLFPGLTDGPYTLAVRAKDPAGNVDATPATYEWTVDTIVPDTILDTKPPALTSATTATFDFSATEPNCSYECSLDGAAFVACTPGFSTGALEDGPHTFAVRAIDPAGNVDATPATWGWTVDATPPDTTIDSKPAALTNSPDAAFEFSSNDPTATFECSLDGGPFAPCPAEHALTGLGDGPHSLVVRAKDPTGNLDPTPARYEWTVDLGVPDTTITAAPAALATSGDATFAYDASEPDCTYACSLDGAAFGPCPASYTGLADGPHTFAVRATDAAGNTDPTPATHNWVVDTTPPDTTIPEKPASFSKSPDATFTFASNDPAATFRCSVDGGPLAPCPANFSLTGLADGPHTLSVVAVDAAGNVDPTPATYAWTVDTKVPDTIIDTHPKARTGKTVAAFTFHATEPDATYACSIDGGDFAPCAPGVQYTALGVGTHTFRVRATDLAGNTDPTPADWAWTIFADRDGDELADDIEEGMGTDPEDGDSDDDGVLDGDEPQGAFDTDGDGLVNALDPDSDNDGLLDGTEMGVVTPSEDTNTDKGHFIADADPSNTTDPLDADTDGGGVMDGAEDLNRDGKKDAGEGDAEDEDDEAGQTDTDGDGLPDAYEEKLGTKPDDADSDDDGSLDGAEANPALDTDGDGKINALDPDSDNDGLFDGTEQNVTAPNKDTDVSKGFFVADADPASKTSPLIADTDKGGVADGTEDFNRNGRVDAGERSPNLGSDDATIVDADGDGILDVADDCPTTANADQADADGDGAGDACDTDADGDGFLDTVSVSGGGCSSSGAPALMALLGLVAGLRRRRR